MAITLDMIRTSADFIKNKIEEFNATNNGKENFKEIKLPKLGVILGSGLGNLADMIENSLTISYGDIPDFPKSTVVGHKGQFVIGNFEGKDVIMMQGRFHYYEGHPMRELLKPVYTMKMLGVESIIVTNAAGGVNTSFKPGTLMIINDHINFSFSNPLIGENIDYFGERFPDMTKAYTKEYIEKAKEVANKLSIDVKEGVYLMWSGPTYETPAEIRAFRTLGADAVGMSTVPEVIAASHAKMKVLGISCITNLAAGMSGESLNHQEVLEVSKRVNSEFTQLLSNIIKEI